MGILSKRRIWNASVNTDHPVGLGGDLRFLSCKEKYRKIDLRAAVKTIVLGANLDKGGST
jgi:hypothetical protein